MFHKLQSKFNIYDELVPGPEKKRSFGELDQIFFKVFLKDLSPVEEMALAKLKSILRRGKRHRRICGSDFFIKANSIKSNIVTYIQDYIIVSYFPPFSLTG